MPCCRLLALHGRPAGAGYGRHLADLPTCSWAWQQHSGTAPGKRPPSRTTSGTPCSLVLICAGAAARTPAWLRAAPADSQHDAAADAGALDHYGGAGHALPLADAAAPARPACAARHAAGPAGPSRPGCPQPGRDGPGAAATLSSHAVHDRKRRCCWAVHACMLDQGSWT